jgi:hypothetical protein
VAYQWSADGTPIPGATSATYLPTPDVVGRTLAVVVTASKAGYADVHAQATVAGPVVPADIGITGEPTVEGTARLGETLTFHPAGFAPADANLSVRWLRAGVPIPGATGSSYRLTAADLGARISTRMRLTKPGYTAVRTRTLPTALVRSTPTLALDLTGARGRATLDVTVTAPSVPVVSGTVRVRSGGQLLAEFPLEDGSATVTLHNLSAGSHSFRVRYTGTSTVAGTYLRRSVPVL